MGHTSQSGSPGGGSSHKRSRNEETEKSGSRSRRSSPTFRSKANEPAERCGGSNSLNNRRSPEKQPNPELPRWIIHHQQVNEPNGPSKIIPVTTCNVLWNQVVRHSKMADVQFIFEDGSILHGHRALLSARSDAFQAMFDNEVEMDESRTGIVRIRDSGPAAFRSFLHYIYSGDLGTNINDVDGRDLWKLADKYGVTDLKEWLVGYIDETSLATAAQFGEDMGDNDLVNACVKLAVTMLPQVLSVRGVSHNIAKLLMCSYRPGIERFRFVERWYRCNEGKPSANADARALLDFVGFNCISSAEVLEEVKPSPLISTMRLMGIYEERICKETWVQNHFFLLRAYGSYGTGNGMFRNPKGLCVTKEGDIVVIDQKNCRIQIIKNDGTFVRAFGMPHVEPGSYKLIRCAVSKKGHIVVTDKKQARVLMYEQDGTLIRSFGSHGDSPEQFGKPNGVAVTNDNQVIVSDIGKHCIHVFTEEGVWEYSFGCHGKGHGQFKEPRGVAAGKDGNIIVADTENRRVQIFRKDGSFVRTFGSRGTLPGQFELPSNVTVSEHGTIVVSDYEQGTIHLFTSEGDFIQRFSTEQTNGFKQLPGLRKRKPSGVAVGSNGSIFVSDVENHDIQVFTSI